MKTTVHVAIPSDARYWAYAAVTAASAAVASSLPIHIHLLDGGLAEAHWESFVRIVARVNARALCSRHRLDMARLDALGKWHGSGITYSRLFLAEILPQDVDWVVSADADLLFLGDIAALWALRDEGALIQPSRDSPPLGQAWNARGVGWYARKGLTLKKPEEYFCVGLSLFNLKGIRKGGYVGKLAAFRQEHPDVPYPDQTVLNYVFQDRKALLPKGWGLFTGDENADIDWARPCAMHFVEDTPWRRWKCTHLMSDCVMLWRDFARRALGAEDEGFFPWRGRLSPRLAMRGESWLGYGIRRAAFLFLKANPWILRLHPALYAHLRSSRGIPAGALRSIRAAIRKPLHREADDVPTA